MLMIILAAETVADCCAPNAALSTELMASRGFVSTGPVVSAKTLRTISSSASSASDATEGVNGDSETGMSTPTAESADEFAPLVADQVSSGMLAVALGANAAIVGIVMSFLPWRRVLQMRGVNRLWFQQSLACAALLRMPSTGLPAVFVPCDRHLNAMEGELEQALAPDAKQPAPGQARLFLGQLRRDATVPMVQWMMDEVFCCPAGSLVAVENHRNRMTMRGKGCAWAYVAETAAQLILSFHRRVFFDMVGGVEGCWVVPPSQTEYLASEISVTGFLAQRPRHLPRSGLVCEVPAGSIPVAELTQAVCTPAYYPNRDYNAATPASSALLRTLPPPPSYNDTVSALSAPRVFCHNPYGWQ